MKKSSLLKAMIAVFVLVLALAGAASAQNFTFTLEPSTLTLVPGQSASFVISLTPLDGFTNQVTLSVSNLPSGVTASFSPQTLTPPGTSLLTLDATTNAANGSFTLDLIAEGGDITNRASSSVSVSFGLLPLCYGAFQGAVTDSQTGLPVPYAEVNASGYYAVADSNGMYIITNLPLSSSENLPAYYAITATQSNYWSSSDYAYAVCDATNIVNVQIVREQQGSISGTLTAEGGQPLTNQTVYAEGQSYVSTVTDSNGFFQFKSLTLAQNNGAAYYTVFSQPSGYWEAETNIIIQANSNAVANLVAIPICYDIVTGSVIYGNTGLPATNISVTVITSDYYYGTTDSNGDYTVTNVTMSTDNNSVTATVEAGASGYYEGSISVALTNCGQTGDAGVISLSAVPPPPTNNYGAVTGHVYDVQTGFPITNANGYVFTYSQSSGYGYLDSNGDYTISNIYVGSGASTNGTVYLYAAATGYFENYTNVVVYAGETSTQDLQLLRIGYGAVTGTVLNSATGLPVAGTYVSIANGYTGANGEYSSGLLQLNAGDTPTFESFYASETGYWMTYTNTTISNNVTNVVNIEFIPVCTGATILGNVINALTEQPITNATVSVYSSGYQSVETDTNGNFILTNITVGNDNSPSAVTLSATAPGFNPQSKSVTIFCDAVISTEFGAPETAFGAIDGYVTNAVTGLPLTNVFIGSSFGEATATDTNGYYILSQAPLNANGSSRSWTVTAGPVTIGSTPYSAQTQSILVSSNMTNQLDFGFGQPLTELVVSASSEPNPVMVGSNLVYTVTLDNDAAAAGNVYLNDTLPPGVTFLSATFSNNPSGEFSTPGLTNGVLTTVATNFASNSVVVLLITVTPNVAGALTNVVAVTSTTPDVNPSGTNHSAVVTDTATAPAVSTLYADLALSMTGSPNPVLVNNQLIYTLLVTNLGPANASDVVLTDTLPANITFSSASVSEGEYALVANTLQWSIGSLNYQGSASATIVVQPLLAGAVTNTATVSIVPNESGVTDTNLANNSAGVVTTVTSVGLTNILIQAGPIVFNPQTGLFQQTFQVTNISGGTASAVRVAVPDLPSNVVLYNATGSTNGVPYVEYDQPLPNGSNVTFLLEYYESSREPFVSTNFVVTVVAAVSVPLQKGTYLQLDTAPFLSQGELTIEFATVPGHTYVVQYSSDMVTWLEATPPILAKNTRTQWVDSGPPETQSPPGSPGQRFYRIVQTN